MSPLPRREHPSSLHGSLDSFPLTDVLSLLGATGNTGALEVTGDGTEGRLFVDDGAVVAGSIGTKDTPVDVLAEMLRLEEGSFTFAPDETPDRPGTPVAMPGLLADARSLLDEWYDLEGVLPSADHVIALAPEAPQDEVVLSAGQWRSLAAIGSGGPVGLLLEDFADDELEARRLLRTLVEAGLVVVVDPAVTDGRGSPAGRSHPASTDAQAPAAGAGEPLLVLRPPAPPRRPVDPVHEARLASLADQLDLLYEAAQSAQAGDSPVPAEAAGSGDAGVDPARPRRFGRRRHRDHR